MTPLETLLRAWDWEPSVVVGCITLAVVYAVVTRCRHLGRTLYFFSGLLLLLLDLVSPIDALADGYLFSAHVVQHVFLALVIPPLLLLGLPPFIAGDLFRHPKLAAMEQTLARPAIAWILGTGTMIFWHAPVLFNAALADDGLHLIQHLSFLVCGTIFWWPILQPLKKRRLAPFSAVSYLFGACLCCTLLGAWMAFGPLDLYPGYQHAQDQLGILAYLRQQGLSPQTDRQLGGLLMWVPGCFVYLTAILATVARWYKTPDVQEVQGLA